MATKIEVYNEALRMVGDLRLASLTDDVEARYALDDAWNRSVLFVASQANWPHAYASLQVNTLTDTSSPGYTRSYTINNANWLRTVSVSLDQHFGVGAHYHEALGKIFVNTSQTNIFVRYIDKSYLGDSFIATWPEMFCSAVSHRLAFEVCERLTQDPQKAQSIYQLFVEVLNLAKSQLALDTGSMMISPAQWAAKAHNATIAEIWEEALRLMGTGDPKMATIQRPVDAKPVHQILEMAWRGVVTYCLSEGYWSFSTKTTLFNSSAGAGIGYTHSFNKPADWLRTADVALGSDPDFRRTLDYRDALGRWNVNASSIYVRYISTDYAPDSAATSWPDMFKRLLACRLAYECVDLVTGIPEKRALLEKEYATQLARALQIDATDGKTTVPKRRNEFISSIWSEALRLMGYDDARKVTVEGIDEAERAYRVLDAAWDRVVRFCLTEHYWNFATTTASILSTGLTSLGFSNGFNKPSDWLRTIHISDSVSFNNSVEYRDQGGRFFANANPIFIRYISNVNVQDGTASSWPEMFVRVVACRLAYECVDVIMGGGEQSRRAPLLEEYNLALASAKEKDAADQTLIIPKRRNPTITAIWKEAARLIGFQETKKATPESETSIESVYQVFDDAWIRVVKFCITEGFWNFATITSQITTPTVSSRLGFRFNKPADWLRTVSISTDANFAVATAFVDEGSFLYAPANSVWISYLSANYIADDFAPNWPESFNRVLAYRLAYECAAAIVPADGVALRVKLLEEYQLTLKVSLEKDAADQSLIIPKNKNATINSIWTEALRLVGYTETKKPDGEKELSAVEVYQILENAWGRVAKFCLTEGYWNFATAVATLTQSSPTIVGFTHGFAKPADWLRTASIASDNAFSTPVEYRDQGGRFYANTTPIYIRYISSTFADDAQHSAWPESFVRVLAYRLAYEVVEVISGDPARREPLLKEYREVVAQAVEKDASDQSLYVPKRRNDTITAIWKEAIRLIGFPETKKANSENEMTVDAVYQIFNDAWTRVVRFCLHEAYWNFATKTMEITASGSPVPGWQFAFNKPNDWLRTIAVSTTSQFHMEAMYHDEGGRLFANHDTLYIRFISNEYGGDNSAATWPEMFCRVLAHRLAYECSDVVSGDPNRATALLSLYKSAVSQSKNKDAMDQAQMFPKTSNWLGAMRGGRYRHDRGSLSGY